MLQQAKWIKNFCDNFMMDCEYDGCDRLAVSTSMIVDKDGWEEYVELCQYHLAILIDKLLKEARDNERKK